VQPSIVDYGSIIYSIRCMIEQINKLCIFFVDTGHRRYLESSECFELPEQFSILPAQAIRCRLFDIWCKQHLNETSDWSQKSVKIVETYRGCCGDVIVKHCKDGNVVRLGEELTAYVVLYKDGEKSSLNYDLSHDISVVSRANHSYPEQATISANNGIDIFLFLISIITYFSLC
jgi:hypothetical protein